MSGILAGCSAGSHTGGPTPARYDQLVLSLGPVAYYHVAGTGHIEPNLAGKAHTGTWSFGTARRMYAHLPDGTRVADLGAGDALTISNAPVFSIPGTGALTVVSWIRPDTLQFSHSTGTGYVYWMGKGTDDHQEWALRMYSLVNTEDRPNRISDYVFNSEGGEGSGAYFQEPVRTREWIMIVFEASTAPSSSDPTGWVSIYRNGVVQDSVGLDQFHVIPRTGPAPVRIGTRDFESTFQGAVGDVAFFDRVLSPPDVAELYRAMTGG